tara:strand:+ start:478 stop:1158 length:681 start_codon:yes stop_codon:yes gene_type:complete
MSLNKIKVYGKLRQDLGCSYFEAAVKSPIEAFRFLSANFPDLEKYMSYQYYKVKMNGVDVVEEEDFNLRSDGVIQIIPIATGSIIKGIIAGIGAIAGGAAVAKATTVGVGLLGAKIVGGLTVGGLVGGALVTTGVSMVTSGVTQMIAPTQNVTFPSSSISSGMSRNDANAPGGDNNNFQTLADSNYSFSGITNVSRSGVAIPVVYGEIFVGSILVSNGIDTAQVSN